MPQTFNYKLTKSTAQSAEEAVEYVDCISACGAGGGKTTPNECSGYDTKQSDDEGPVLEL